MTMSAWIKVNAFTRNWSNVISKGDNSWRIARLSRTNTNHNAPDRSIFRTHTRAGWPANGPNTTISVNDNFWHHVCGTYDGQMIRTYIDGVLDVEAPYSGLINTSTYPIQIAGIPGELTGLTSGRQWDGVLDEIRVYNYALSETEIRALTVRARRSRLWMPGPSISLKKPARPFQMDGMVMNYGTPRTVTTLWTTVSGPDAPRRYSRIRAIRRVRYIPELRTLYPAADGGGRSGDCNRRNHGGCGSPDARMPTGRQDDGRRLRPKLPCEHGGLCDNGGRLAAVQRPGE